VGDVVDIFREMKKRAEEAFVFSKINQMKIADTIDLLYPKSPISVRMRIMKEVESLFIEGAFKPWLKVPHSGGQT